MGTASDEASARALAELAALLGEMEADVERPERGYDHQGRVTAREFAMHALHHGLQFWLEADPARPWFHRWFSPSKKLLGDNPDCVYYGTVIDPRRAYRIRGNLAGAVYTSFTVELGTAGGGMSQRLGATLNDDELEVAADGSYEIVASPDERPGNWLRLDPEAGSLTTRHYFELDRCAALDPTLEIPLSIEPLDDPGEPPIPDDEAVATGIRRVITFARSVTVDFGLTPPPPGAIPWSSPEPNRFTNPDGHDGNLAIGYAATDNVYRSARYRLDPDEALVIRGRFPRCRFANVVIFNRHMQTLPHRSRRVSLNRRQVHHEPDGTFTMVVAHRDPGHPNWLDTRGAQEGTLFWRFLLPEEPLADLDTEVVPVDRAPRPA